LGYQINALVDFALKPINPTEALHYEVGDFYFVAPKIV
jgi:hypothetical protein